MKVEKILRNSAKCLECNEEIVSAHRHDFRRCSCGNICVDGGKDYIRRAFRSGNYEDTSVIETVDTEAPTVVNSGGRDERRNQQPAGD